MKCINATKLHRKSGGFTSLLCAQKRDHMICLHDAHQPVRAIHHRQRMQIVLVEKFCDFILMGLGLTGDNARFGKNRHPRLGQGQYQARQRDDALEHIVMRR